MLSFCRRRLGLLICGLFMMVLLVGCHEPERRKVTVIEEQEEGEVVEESPGEMIVTP